MEAGFRKYRSSHQFADLVLLEPDRADEEVFFTNIFSYASRRALCEHAYQATRRDLLARKDALAPVLEKRGMSLNLDHLTDKNRTLDISIGASSEARVIIYNKPIGEVCTRHDPEGRPTVFHALPKLKQGRWIAIGRLDINTSGLLIFTTDGEIANKMMHPSSNIDREYAVRVLGEVDDDMLERLKQGVLLEDGMAKFTDVRYFDGEGANRWYHCVVMEGRNREVRRLWESQNVQVSRLKRVRFGPVFLPSDVKVGTWRDLSQKELDVLTDELELERRSLPKFDPHQARDQEREYRRQRVRQRDDARNPHQPAERKKRKVRVVGKRG